MSADLHRLARAYDRTTPGEWYFVVRKKGDGVMDLLVAAVERGHVVLSDHPGGRFPTADGEFIALAHNSLPAVIAEIKALREWRDNVTVAVQNPGEARYDEIPDLIRAMRADIEALLTMIHELPKFEWERLDDIEERHSDIAEAIREGDGA